MPLPKAAIAVAAIAAAGLGAVAFGGSKKRRVSSRLIAKVPPKIPTTDHPICKKYPGGTWAPGHGDLEGFPSDKPGWSAADLAMATEAVEREVAAAPGWGSVSDARELAFSMTRRLIVKWCPSLAPKLPAYREHVDEYISKSLALRWLWQSVHQMIWQRMVGDAGGGN